LPATRTATVVGVPRLAAGASAALHVNPAGTTAPNDDDGESGGLAVLLAAVTDVVAQPTLPAPTAPGFSLSHLDPAYQSTTLARESNGQWWGGGGAFAAHGRSPLASSLLFNRVIQQAKMQRQMQQQAMQHVTTAVRHLTCAF
jgi:hypothetical protein